jgi:hypothetical protein
VSIYGRRKGIKDLIGPYHTPLHTDTVAPQPVVDPASAFAHLRKSSPTNRLLPVGAQWLARLPGDVAPQALARQYPRIVNLLALQWSDRGACAAYFDDLLTDRRGGRQGFPPDVQRDLARLRDYWYSGSLELR